MEKKTRWYRVRVFPRAGEPIGEQVQAASPDKAMRAVMRKHRVEYAPMVTIWRMGDLGFMVAPLHRVDVACRMAK